MFILVKEFPIHFLSHLYVSSKANCYMKLTGVLDCFEEIVQVDELAATLS